MNTTMNIFKFPTIILVIFTALRAIGTGFAGLSGFQMGAHQNIYLGTLSLCLALIYVAGIIGIAKRKKAAIWALLVLAVLDLLSALQIGGATGLGAGIFDAVIALLAYKEIKSISVNTNTVVPPTSTETK